MKIDSFNDLLQRKSTSIVVLCVATFAKILQQIYFFVPTLDRAVQLVMAKNFLNGNGLSINKVLADGVTETFIPVSSWPPGYPVLVGAISFIFHISILNAAIVFDCISIALIIYFSRQILLTINCQLKWVNIYTLLIAFFLFDFCELPATDLNALAFYLWSIAIALRVIKKGRITNAVLILLIIINIIPLSLKYLYAPLIFIPPLYLLWIGFKMKNNPFRRIGLKFTAGTLLLTIALFIFQRLYTGNAVYVSEAVKGFFFSNLRNYYYIIISSFTNIVFDYFFLQRLNLIKFGEYYFVIWWINLILSILLIFYFVKALNKKHLSAFSLKFHYITMGALTCFITLFELIILSIRYYIKTKSETWTYIQEARYMAFIVLFLQHVYFIYIYDNWATLKPRLLKVSGYVIVFFLAIEFIHGIYFTIKISSDGNNYFNPNSVDAPVMKSIRERIRYIKKDHPEKTVYFFSTEDIFCYMASLENAKTIDTHDLYRKIQAVNNSVILIVKDRNEPESSTLSGCSKFNTIGKFDLYQCK